MTICAAAFSAKSKAIVMVADQAITHGIERPIISDIGVKKILPIGKTGWHALMAGDPSFAQEVIGAVSDAIADETKPHHAAYPGTLKAMMGCVKACYKSIRRQWVIDRFISPRFLDEKDPYSNLPDEYKEALAATIADFSISCSLLICGFDGKGMPHVFSVVWPGVAASHDTPSFHAIGIGRDLALGQLYQYETTESQDLDETMYELFDAKATAEMNPNVGYLWDCCILVPNREPVDITQKVRAALEHLLAEATASPYHPKFGSDFAKVPEWKKTIKEFADSILQPASVSPTVKARRKQTTQRPKSKPRTSADQP